MYKFGDRIGVVKVADENLEVFCNKGYENGPSPFFTEDDAGNFLGIKYHCVELVRRFLYQKTGKNFAEVWQEGHAGDWWGNGEVMEAERISVGASLVGAQNVQVQDQPLREGDIICFSGGMYGHVGVVSGVSGEEGWVEFCHQNFFGDERDLKTKFFLDQKILEKDGGEFYVLQGFLRFGG